VKVIATYIFENESCTSQSLWGPGLLYEHLPFIETVRGVLEEEVSLTAYFG